MSIDLNKLSKTELKELSNEINIKLNKLSIVEEKIEIDNKRKYIGRCYKKKVNKGYNYIMVVSNLSLQYCLDCLSFNDFIEYKRTSNLSFDNKSAYAKIECDLLKVKPLNLLEKQQGLNVDGSMLNIDKYEEISKETFYKELNKFMNLLKEYLNEEKFNDLSSYEPYMRRYQ